MKRSFRKIISAACVVSMSLLLFTGCAGASFTTTSVGDKTTIEAKEAEDGASGETSHFSVGKDRKAVIESSLDKGELKIDFAAASVYYDPDTEIEDVTVLDVVSSVTVGAGESEELSLEPGDYVMQYTAVGAVSGKVIVDIEKQ